MRDIDKLEVEEGGCSSKFSPMDLQELMSVFSSGSSSDLVVGKENFDDAAVWKFSDGSAVIQTVDFFPALCEEPYYFGQIAAANSISDIYAMGAEPKFALNIVMFPPEKEKRSLLKEILKGGADKLQEAGIIIAGGHTIKDDIPKYGLTVTGLCSIDHILKNSNAKEGEKVVLTKALGTGVALAGKKMGELSDENYSKVIQSMCQLNNVTEILHKCNVKCATDITGFGLAGHCLEMAVSSNVTINIQLSRLPVLKGIKSLLDIGCMPCALFNNLRSYEDKIKFSEGIDYSMKMLCFDAQTSGGLLFTCKEENAEELISELHCNGFKNSVIIGDVMEKDKTFSLCFK